MTELTEPILDGIKELVNIGIGKAAGSLNSLTGYHVKLNVPEIHVTQVENLREIIPQKSTQFSVIYQGYYGAFVGTTALIFPEKSAKSLFFLLTGEKERTKVNDNLWRMTLLEIGNIIVNSVMGTITNILEERLEFLLPEYKEDSMDSLFEDPKFVGSKYVIVIRAQFCVKEREIRGDTLLLLADKSIDALTSSIREKVEEKEI